MLKFNLFSFLFFLFFQLTIAAVPDFEVFTQDGKQGLKNNLGEIIIPPQYEVLGWSFSTAEVRNGRIGFRKNDLWGVISINNKILYPPKLEAIFDANGSVIIAGKEQVNGKFKKGALNYEGKQLIPYDYNLLISQDTRLLAYRNKNYGVLSFQNKVIIPFQYKRVEYKNDQRWLAFDRNNKGAVFNNQGEQLTDHILDDLQNFDGGFAVAKIGNFEGLLTKEGHWKLEPIYKEIYFGNSKAYGKPFKSFKLHENPSKEWLADSVMVVGDDILQFYASGKSWLESYDGKIVFPIADLIEVQENWLTVTKEGLTGLFNLKDSVWSLEPTYLEGYLVNNNLFYAKSSFGQSLLIDPRKGDQILENFEEIQPSTEYIKFRKKGHWGALATEGTELLSPVYDSVSVVKEGRAIVKFHGEWGIMTLNEEWIVVPQKEFIYDFNKNVYLSKDGDMHNVFSLDGERIYFSTYPLELRDDYIVELMDGGRARRLSFSGLSIKSVFRKEGYVEVLPLSEGLIGILKSGRYGFIDPRGRLLIANRYEGIQPFINGLAAVKIQGRWGVINKRERIVVQPHYDSIGLFYDDKAIVADNNKKGIIDAAGEVLLNIAYDDVYSESGYYVIIEGKEKGIADKTGKVIVWPRFDDVFINGDYIIVQKEGKFGIYNERGISILPPIYDLALPVPDINDIIIGRSKKLTEIAIK